MAFQTIPVDKTHLKPHAVQAIRPEWAYLMRCFGFGVGLTSCRRSGAKAELIFPMRSHSPRIALQQESSSVSGRGHVVHPWPR